MQTENSTTRDLIAELATVTEVKMPSAAPVTEWNFENPNKLPVTDTPATTATTTPGTTTAPTNQEPKGEKKLSAREIKLAAQSSQAMVEFATSQLAELALAFKYGGKFTKEEKNAINNDLLHRAPDQLTEPQAMLVARWRASEKTREKKLKKLDVTEAKRQRMIESFERYSELTDKVFITPGTALAVEIGESIVKSIMAVVID